MTLRFGIKTPPQHTTATVAIADAHCGPPINATAGLPQRGRLAAR